jgi:hypothetical protein
MQIVKNFIAIALIVLLVGCAKPVPKEKESYVGEWSGTAMTLLITQDGSVAYRRLEGGINKSIDGPLKGFEGDNFVVGIGPLSTTFIVSSPPQQAGGVWRMTVDGVVLTKKTAEQEKSVHQTVQANGA